MKTQYFSRLPGSIRRRNQPVYLLNPVVFRNFLIPNASGNYYGTITADKCTAQKFASTITGNPLLSFQQKQNSCFNIG